MAAGKVGKSGVSNYVNTTSGLATRVFAIDGAPTPSGFAILDSSGASFSVGLTVLDSADVSYLVSSTVLDSNDVPYNPI
jgi:hypothetical protein